MVELTLDTNAVSAFFDGQKEVVDRIDLASTLFLPAIVVGEFSYGALKSKNVEVNLQKLKIFTAGCEIIVCDSSVARRYADAKIDLERKGKLIPENDMWIAACAMEVDRPLLTNDGHFDHVEGIERISW